MGALERDPAATATTLQRWLTDVAGLEHARVDNVAIPGGTGWSNETIFFDVRWRRDGEDQHDRLVARIAPSVYSVFLEETFDRQHVVMRALARHSTVPMATIHWFEDDTSWFGRPFWIMARVEGDIPADNPPYAGSGWLHDASPERQAAAWWSGIDAMAEVHSVDVRSLVLPAGTFPDAVDNLGWQLEHYDAFLTWAEEGAPHAKARDALRWLQANRPPDPAQGASLVWGDARLSNLIYRDCAVVAVLDWEMCALGDPLLDVGWWVFADQALTAGAGFERLPGFPTAAATTRRWGELTGRSTEAFDYFVLFAAFRFTVIMLRMGKLLHGMGLVPSDFAYENLISTAMVDLLERA